jgi:hypothetical protein
MSRRDITVTGSQELVALLPSLLSGTSFSATPHDATHSLLTSPLLEAAPDVDTFLEEARTLLRRIGGLHQIYVGSSGELRLDRYTYQKDAGGENQWAALSNSVRLTVTTTTGLPHLQSPIDSGDTTCSELLSTAARDERLGRAIALVGNEPLGWHGIYDVLEAINRREERIVALFKPFEVNIDLNYLNDLGRTANHHRHAGNLQGYPLPNRKIELHEARQFIARLLQFWLERCRPNPGNLEALQVPTVATDIVLALVPKPSPAPE